MQNGQKTMMNTHRPKSARPFANRSKQWTSNVARPAPPTDPSRPPTGMVGGSPFRALPQGGIEPLSSPPMRPTRVARRLIVAKRAALSFDYLRDLGLVHVGRRRARHLLETV